MSRFSASFSSEFLLSLGMWPDCPRYVSFRPLEGLLKQPNTNSRAGFPLKKQEMALFCSCPSRIWPKDLGSGAFQAIFMPIIYREGRYIDDRLDKRLRNTRRIESLVQRTLTLYIKGLETPDILIFWSREHLYCI